MNRPVPTDARVPGGRRAREPHRRSTRVAGRSRRMYPVAVAMLVPAAIVFGVTAGLLAIAMAGLFLLINVIPLLMVAAIAIGVGRHRARRRRELRRGAAGLAPVPGRPAALPRPDRVWAHAQQRFQQLRAEYAAFECDAMRVLRLPALADVTVPSTGRFVDAFAEAQALDTDAFPGPEHGRRFVAAVDRAERAWRAAREAAERIRLSGLDPAERAAVERIIKLLTTARDSDIEPERLAAYTRARAELTKLDATGVLHVPLPAQAALDEAARGQLPA
ncbi:hypothetical protein [Pseudonocardia humida]|uniref:DUF2786 domain-containing protein n=1 Tax=Pseudonocardia humida TaxID=2800819 RepID=A0ABT0ZUI3_9PSEU|nr:hypothetical protein [Pseudonocardia humida]MCO1654329.1 hypothetical protein [Pseudonocardia humida]